MNIVSTVKNSILYVLLKGELDEHSASYTHETLDKLFTNDKIKQVILDLSQLDFMDSTGIGVFFGRYKKLAGRGIPLFVANPSTQADKILKMSGIYQIVKKISTGGKYERVR